MQPTIIVTDFLITHTRSIKVHETINQNNATIASTFQSPTNWLLNVRFLKFFNSTAEHLYFQFETTRAIITSLEYNCYSPRFKWTNRQKLSPTFIH